MGNHCCNKMSSSRNSSNSKLDSKLDSMKFEPPLNPRWHQWWSAAECPPRYYKYPPHDSSCGKAHETGILKKKNHGLYGRQTRDMRCIQGRPLEQRDPIGNIFVGPLGSQPRSVESRSLSYRLYFFAIANFVTRYC